jgi:hypothetical protein
MTKNERITLALAVALSLLALAFSEIAPAFSQNVQLVYQGF